MSDLVIVRRNSYHDSARLMAISRRLRACAGVAQAEVMMGTPMNCEMLARAGFHADQLAPATPLDLVLALRGDRREDLESAARALDGFLSGPADQPSVRERTRPRSIAEAVALHPAANLVSIAVPGPYAAFAAHRALDAGRHVFLFSDNVPLADEVTLKRRAAALGLLVMGPDCGTAIVAGIGLGFANRVRRGPVGIVGASGTGIQEMCCLLDAHGVGISQAIGTGSRDLKAAVDGLTTRLALQALAEDAMTKVIVLVAKHPDPAVAERIHDVLARLRRQAVVRYLGEEPRPSRDGVRYAPSLDDAAAWALQVAGGRTPATPALSAGSDRVVPDPGCRMVGLFGGGSLAAEAKCVLDRHGLPSVEPAEVLRPDQPLPGRGHLIVDTGDDAYTVGRPHPMVDQAVRCGLIRSSGADAAVGVVLFDLVLGDGAHPDPAPELASAVTEARRARGPAPVAFVASVSGTASDPQGLDRQRAALQAAGVWVEPSGARAAEVAAALLGRGPGRS